MALLQTITKYEIRVLQQGYQPLKVKLVNQLLMIIWDFLQSLSSSQ